MTKLIIITSDSDMCGRECVRHAQAWTEKGRKRGESNTERDREGERQREREREREREK